MNRILIIRGGAIGDFLLTLPTLKALRDACPDARIEILGYKHIATLAENRFYAQAIRSIEYGPLSGFFATGSELSKELADYFASFDLIISYLYDPDGIFEMNLRRCGAKKLVQGPAKIVEKGDHASRQLARPVEELGIKVVDLTEKIFLFDEDRQFARTFLRGSSHPIIAIHPGSGSKEKNWPLESWIHLLTTNGGVCMGQSGEIEKDLSLVVVLGEADQTQSARLEHVWKHPKIRFAKNLQLPDLATLFEHAVFIGHDSGISHLAAAAGARCVLLFGPTDPNIWAPRNENVQVLRADGGRIEDLKIAQVEAAITAALSL